ncbi:uncharacterized protein METZ01_LOCUS467336, partial [marine metagenome]
AVPGCYDPGHRNLQEHQLTFGPDWWPGDRGNGRTRQL